MRLDHVAYRVADRQKTVEWLRQVFGYQVAEEFQIDFDDGECAKCFALTPPEKEIANQPFFAWAGVGGVDRNTPLTYHLSPEIFVSDGTPDSVVGRWVAERGGIGGIHHLAYEVANVHQTMDVLSARGLATFTSEKPIMTKNGDLVQVFTEVHPLTGVIYEFIERRGARGFNTDSVRDLMISTDERK